MITEESELFFTKADTNLMREWFDAVLDLNPDYLEEKDFTLAKKLYSESELRTPNEVLEKANGTKESSGEPLPINARVSDNRRWKSVDEASPDEGDEVEVRTKASCVTETYFEKGDFDYNRVCQAYADNSGVEGAEADKVTEWRKL